MMDYVSKEMNKIVLTEEERQATEPNERVLKFKELVKILHSLNFIVYPLIPFARRLGIYNKELFDSLEKNMKIGVENKIVPEVCQCMGCRRHRES